MIDSDFYKKGLRFQCTQCSACCRHDPGYVFLTAKDLEAFSKHFKMTEEDFKKTYCRIVDFGFVKRLSLREKPNYDCIFWEQGGCSAYEARPLQCRAFPFWPRNLSSKEDWDEAAKDCPGMNQGTLHSPKTIQTWLDSYSEFDLLED